MSSTVANIDVTNAILRLGLRDQITLKRANQGAAIVDGRYADAATDDVQLFATVQSYQDENQSLPEAVRSKRMINVWSNSEIKPVKRAEGTSPDRVVWNGSEYEVYDFWDRSTDGGYWKALCTAVDQ